MGRYCATKRCGKVVVPLPSPAPVNPITQAGLGMYDEKLWLMFEHEVEGPCTVLIWDLENPGEPLVNQTSVYPVGECTSLSFVYPSTGHTYQGSVQHLGYDAVITEEYEAP